MRDKTEESEILYNSINYLNSIKFRINKPMLNFILGDGGINGKKHLKYLMDITPTVLETDTIPNIYTLATLYKDKVFYLPVYVDLEKEYIL